MMFEHPVKEHDYKICGKQKICDYCESIGYDGIGKCGMKKVMGHGFYNDRAIKPDNSGAGGPTA
jgi:hypothetical protein